MNDFTTAEKGILYEEMAKFLDDLKQKFSDCLRANYTTVANGASFAVKRGLEYGDTLTLYFEWSNGKEDWKNNFAFPAKPYRDMADKWKCHGGFLKVWKSIEPYVSAYINDPAVKKIEIVGYSHGAAIALLCHEYCKYNRPDIEIKGYGFGCPRVFWGEASEQVMKRFSGFLVIKNGKDIVTHLPPNIFGFRHVGGLLQVGTSKGVIKDHFPLNYLRNLEFK